MKKLFVKILSLILLLSLVGEKVSSFFPAAEQAMAVIDVKEESKDGKDIENEKTKSNKEKSFKELLYWQTIDDDQSLFVLEHIDFKYSAYLSLPEIPPDRA